MRILLLGDYSNCHRTLATGLRSLGCDVTVASDGSRWMDTARDVDVSRRWKSKAGGFLHWINLERLLCGRLSGFDIVAVNDPVFASLRPERMHSLLTHLKKHNGALFYTAMSTDIAYLDMVASPDTPLRYSEWFVEGKPSRMNAANPAKWYEWHSKELVGYQNRFFDEIDGAVSVLYEYHLGMEKRLGKDKAAYGGLPVDTELYEPVELPEDIEKVRLFLGRDRLRKLMKGSDLLEEAARDVICRHHDKAELTIVENRPFSEFTALLKSAHVVLDQIYSYTPATTALMAMSYGLNVVSGAEPEYYDFIGETENRPIVNAPIDLEELVGVMEDIVLNPGRIADRGRRLREFAVKHNDCRVVARRFLDFWKKRIEER